MSDKDMVNSPEHYNFAGVECIDAIRAATGEEGFQYYLQGNIMKYLWRFDYKDKPIEDLQKAKWYLELRLGTITVLELKWEAKRFRLMILNLGFEV